MKASQIAIAPGSVCAIGPRGDVSCIERRSDGLWGRWQGMDAGAKSLVHAGQVVAAIGLDDRVSALQVQPRLPWVSLDLTAMELAATHLPDGAPALFALADDGRIRHAWKPAPSSPWSQWQPLDGAVTGLAAECIPGGGLVVFGIRGEAVSHRWQDHPYGSWQSWTDLEPPPGGAQALAASTILRGGLALFALAGDGGLHHRWQDKPFGKWHDWQPLGEGIKTFAAARSLTGGLVVFAVGPDDLVRYRFQPTAFGHWGGWNDLHGRAKALAGQPGYMGGLEVFSVGMTDEVSHKWCDRLDAPWTEWAPLDYEASPLRLRC
jgi:hypothetical protein